jgi:hypothetical protein
MLGLLLVIVFIVVLLNIAASRAVLKWPRLRKH